jgi:tetratricopeptide (TPR) repeat protein
MSEGRRRQDLRRWTFSFVALALASLILSFCAPSVCAQNAGRPEERRSSRKNLFISGQQALARNNLDEAEKDFRQVLSLDPNNAGAHANLGVIAERRKQWTRALAELKAAEKLAPGVPGVRLDIGLVYYREGDYPSAIAPLRSVVRDEPQSAQARYLLGLCYFFTEHYTEALQALEPLWNQESKDMTYLYVMSVASGETNQRTLENRAVAQLLAVGGDSPEMHLLMGKADLARLANHHAIAELERAVQGNPSLPYVHFYLGIAARRLHDFTRAKAEFLKDLTIDPDVPYTYDELGLVCSYLQQNQEARRYYRKALRLNPRLATAYYGLAEIDLREKQYDEALNALDQAGKLDPHSASVYYLRGRVLLGMGRRAQAQSQFETAARMQKAIRDELQHEISGAKLPEVGQATIN